jgi:hypothetical protein
MSYQTESSADHSTENQEAINRIVGRSLDQKHSLRVAGIKSEVSPRFLLATQRGHRVDTRGAHGGQPYCQ